MLSLFRRKPTNLVEESVADVTEPEPDESARPKGYTPSKREQGRETPKRASLQRRRAVDTPADRREAAKLRREKIRQERREASAGMRAGDERYLLARDRGPERALVRDIVDSRRTVGTFFFAGALVVLIGSSAAMPPEVRLASNTLWGLLAVGLVLDSVLISRRVKKLIRERFPKTTQRMGSLYLYAIMRSITFRRMRMPAPRVKLGESI
ncbi:MAG TPA: DUF3043 domain-containing protein [Pilimelia sp.]|nr:DUF3043 domain-containing protein [Pilimelia sp.]